jgi:hypothetical protein
MLCENPNHKQHLKVFLKKYPTANRNAKFAIITVNPEDWAIDLEHPEKNTIKCCQMCSIQESIKQASSPDRIDQPVPGDRCTCQ